MEKEFIPYEEALALKELGFDEPCFGYFLNDRPEIFYNTSISDRINSKAENIFQSDIGITRPLYQQCFRWFREKYGLIGCVDPIYSDETRTDFYYWFFIADYKESDDEEDLHFNTYEEAELECLKKLIEITKNK